MGAKTPASTEKRQHKCDHCELLFQTFTALKSHLRSKHPSEVKKDEESENNDVKKTACVPPTARVSKRLQLRNKSGDSTEMPAKNQDAPSASRKAQFECPICLKMFPVYFSALKHIEKKHKADSADENSSDRDVKPILRETCTLCEKLIIAVHHACEENQDTKKDGGTYSCLGCENKFMNVCDFDQHVSVAHNEDVEVMAFKDTNDFLLWKSSMESQVHAKYLTLSNSSNKQYYQCNYVSPKNSADVTHLCPSLVTLRQARKGVRIHYYKNHHGHNCPEYKVPKPYIENVVINAQNDFDSLLEKKDDSDLHDKFVNLMKNIIERSEGVNLTKIKRLYSLASNMENILNRDSNKNSDDESINNDDTEFDNTQTNKSIKTMTDDQISKVLETPRTSVRMKRKSDSFTPNIMKRKKTGSDTSLKEINSTAKNLSPVVGKPRHTIGSPSFNDSYKEFIGSTTPSDNTPKTQNTTSKKPRKEVVKTKIGQFIPSPEKKKSPLILKKKGKTKSPDNSLNNYSLDMVDFEVVEQENDCNIIVLKI